MVLATRHYKGIGLAAPRRNSQNADGLLAKVIQHEVDYLNGKFNRPLESYPKTENIA